MNGKKWTQDEINYLKEHYGKVSIGKIAKNLNRSIKAVKIKRTRLGLGLFLENGDYISFRQLALNLGYTDSTDRLKKQWIDKKGLPVIRKRIENGTFMVVRIKDFWAWAEKNKAYLNFSKFPKFALGAEPDWVGIKREFDIKNTKLKIRTWTKKEDEHLKSLLNSYTYNYKEISEILNRSEIAVSQHINKLGLKQRPLKQDDYKRWSDEEKEILRDMILKGAKYENIASELRKRSSLSIKQKVYQMYGSKDLDKARARIIEITKEVGQC